MHDKGVCMTRGMWWGMRDRGGGACGGGGGVWGCA